MSIEHFLFSFAHNYDEGPVAESRPDFAHKLNIALKELVEAEGWLNLLAVTTRLSLILPDDVTERESTKAQAELRRLNSELERRVREQAAQLQALNEELEVFAYSVSHDLRAPLRSIRGFSEVLLERNAAQLDARGREFLQRVCESSVQMEQLLGSLLELSRVGRAELHLRPVDVTGLAASIVEGLRHSDRAREVRLALEPGLKASGDSTLLRVVLEKLLDNAWKFTSRQPNTLIEVGFDPAQSAFYVRDNGVGFDMSRAERLFGVFQRLHSTAEFPGTGAGLAIARRIVNRHGGRVWAEAAIDKGATFYFSLPRAGA